MVFLFSTLHTERSQKHKVGNNIDQRWNRWSMKLSSNGNPILRTFVDVMIFLKKIRKEEKQEH